MKVKFLWMSILSLLIRTGIAQEKNFDSLHKVIQKTLDDTATISKTVKLSDEYRRSGHLKEAEILARLAYQQSKKHNLIRSWASASNILGIATVIRGETDSALFYFNTARELFHQIRDTSREVGILNNLGLVYRTKGDYMKTLDYFFQSLKVKEQLHDSMAMGNTYHNLADLYLQLLDTHNNLKYNLLALRIRHLIKDSNNEAHSYIQLGHHSLEMGKRSIARSYLTSGLQLAKKIRNEELAAEALMLLGEYYRLSENSVLARWYYDQALEKAEQMEHGRIITGSRYGLALIYQSQGKLNAALKEGLRALKQARDIGDNSWVALVSELLSRIYLGLGDTRLSLVYSKLEDSLHHSMLSSTLVREMAIRSINYDHERRRLEQKKEQEKELALDNEQKRKKNILLAALVIFLIVVVAFSYNLLQRHKINRVQKAIIEKQQEDMISSINYAKRIQDTFLVGNEYLKSILPGYFTLFLPKDIVSGDFYWALQTHDYLFVAVCDCTGHGVPGAFLSLLNIHYLKQAVEEKELTEPGAILDHVREQLLKNLDGRDGMDAILIRLPRQQTPEMEMCYASANNSPLLFHGNEIIKFNRDRMSVGRGETLKPFNTYRQNVAKGDFLYLFTDGFADQFGGPEGKKLRYKQVVEALTTHRLENMNDQKQLLHVFFQAWKGPQAQTDDVTVLGIKF